MARKRINKRFIIALAATAGVLGGGGLLAYKYRRLLHPANAQQLVIAGDNAVRVRDFNTAVGDYSQASALAPQDVSIHIKLAKSMFELRNVVSDAFTSSIDEFTKAEEISPTSTEAWKGLLQATQVRVDDLADRPSDGRDRDQLPAAMHTEREAAEHLLALEPTNVDAQVAEPVLLIRQWLLKLPLPQLPAERDLPPDKQTPPDQRAQRAVAELIRLRAEHLDNDLIPFWIGKAKIYQAQQMLQTGRPDDAAALFAEAASAFDPCIAARPAVAPLYLNQATILEQLSVFDPSQKNETSYRARSLQALDKAQSIVDPNAPEYLTAKRRWATAVYQSDPAGAEAAYKDLIKHFPNEISLRRELAQMLSYQPSRRADAIAMLDSMSTVPQPAITDAQARSVWDRQMAVSKLIRVNIENMQLAGMPAGKARDNVVKDIEDSLAYAQTQFAGSPQWLRAKGKFQLINGQPVDAIQTFAQAAEKMAALNQPLDYELLHDEASAYESTREVSKAIDLMEKAMSEPRIAAGPQIHRELAGLYLENQEYARAKPYVDWLAQRFPNDPDVIHLEISVLGPGADPEAVKPFYDQLPESKPAEIAAKCRVAAQIKNTPETIRLMKALNQANPGNVTLAKELAQLLYSNGQPSDASNVLTEAQKHNPDDLTLEVMKKEVNGANRSVVMQDELAALQATKDPFVRQLKLAEFYNAAKRPEDAMAAMEEARKIQPNNVQVLTAIFLHHMESREYPAAQLMLPHLAEVNADTAHGLNFKCRLQLATRDIPNAIATGRQLTTDFAQLAGSWNLYGQALRASGQLDLACQQFSTALELTPTDIDSRRQLIDCSVLQGKIDDAKTYVIDAVKRFPDNPAYREMQVQFEINYGDPASVMPGLAEAIKERPDRVQNYRMLAAAQSAVMHVAVARGDTDGANQDIEQLKATLQHAQQLDPDDLPLAMELTDAYVQSKDFPSAEQVLNTLIARPKWKNQVAPLIQLGKLYLEEKKPDEAQKLAYQALSINPKAADAYLILADALVNQKREDDALAALKPDTGDPMILEKYTDLLLSMNRGAQAEVAVNTAIAANPGDSGLKNLLISVYDSQGKRDKELKAVSDALAEDPGDGLAYYWLAKLDSTGPAPDFDQAIKDLTFYRNYAPGNADARLLMARLKDATHDHDGAIHELELASRFMPSNRTIRKALLTGYLLADPPRIIDADQFMNTTLAMPLFQHDPEFEAEAALVWAHEGEGEKAVPAIQDAMSRAPDPTPLLQNYFNILVLTKNYSLVMDESAKYIAAPNAAWYILNARAQAEYYLGDQESATSDFNTALDRSGIDRGRLNAEVIAVAIRDTFGSAKARQMVVPRAENSTAWKVVAIDLYRMDSNVPAGIKMLEPTLASIDSLPLADQFHVYEQASTLYLSSDPPMVDQAMKIFQKMLTINPQDVEAMNDMACVYIDMVNPPQLTDAMTWSKRAYESNLKTGHFNPRVCDTYAWVLIRTGSIDKGIELLHDVLRETNDTSDFPDVHYHLAQAFVNKQQLEDAQPEFVKASEMIRQEITAHRIVDLALKNKVDTGLKEVNAKLQAKNSG